MQRVHWTEAQRQQALEIYERDGAAEASRQTGIPVATISSWARRAGRTAITPEREAAIAAKNLTLAQRKGELADALLGDCVRLRRQIFAKFEVDGIMVGLPPIDQKRTAETLVILLDKVLLLSGEATSRTEMLTGSNDVHERALAAVVELRPTA